MKKRCLLLLLALVMVLSFVTVPTQAANGEGRSYEVVLLIDSSGSMKYADPERISMEAAEAFAYYYPSEAEYFNISVVLYNTDVLTAVRSVDVSKTNGMDSFQSTMKEIGSKAPGEKFNGLTLWTGETDIGGAIMEADKILSASNATTKAVLLFTDGKLDLDNNPNVTTDAEVQSKNNAVSCADKFGTMQIPLYTVGLNYNNGVDKGFLQDLAERSDGEYRVCTSAEELMPFFQDLYAKFVDGTFEDGDSIVVQPNVDTDYRINLCGQAISEANMVLFSTAKIDSFTITNPNGAKVAWSTPDGGYEVVNPADCRVTRNEMTVNVKLLRPADGNWTITFSSKEYGTVQVGAIYLYDLQVKAQAPDFVDVGASFEFRPVLHNRDTKADIESFDIYNDSECIVTITNTSTNRSESFVAQCRKDGLGYTLKQVFAKPGVYKVGILIKNKQFEESTSCTITVLEPELKLSADKTTCQRGEQVTVTAQLTDSEGKPVAMPTYLKNEYNGECPFTITQNGSKITPASWNDDGNGKFTCVFVAEQDGDYTVNAAIGSEKNGVAAAKPLTVQVWRPTFVLNMAADNMAMGNSVKAEVVLSNPITGEKLPISQSMIGQKLTATILLDGQALTQQEIEITESGIQFNYKPEKVGKYTVRVTDGVYTSQDAIFEVAPSSITAGESIEEVTGSVLFGQVEKEIELDEIFKDSDGDALIYDVSFDGNGVDVKVEDGVLYLVAQGGAQGTVTLEITDGRGAKHVVSFNVNVSSMMTLFIIGMVVLVLIIISIPVMIIVIKKRSIPRIKYRVRVVFNPMGEGTEAVYEINKASNNRRGKPVMTLKEILDLSTLCNEIRSELTEEQYQTMLFSFANRVSITGYPFKDGLKITTPDGKSKSYSGAIASVQLKSEKSDDDTVIQFSFGKITALE